MKSPQVPTACPLSAERFSQLLCYNGFHSPMQADHELYVAQLVAAKKNIRDKLQSLQSQPLSKKSKQYQKKKINLLKEAQLLVFVLCPKNSLESFLTHALWQLELLVSCVDFVKHIEVVLASADIQHYMRFMQLASRAIDQNWQMRSEQIEAFGRLLDHWPPCELVSAEEQWRFLSASVEKDNPFVDLFKQAIADSHAFSALGIDLIQSFLEERLTLQQRAKVHVRSWAGHYDSAYHHAVESISRQWQNDEVSARQAEVSAIIKSTTDSFFATTKMYSGHADNHDIKILYHSLKNDDHQAACDLLRRLVEHDQVRVLASLEWLLGEQRNSHFLQQQYPEAHPIIITHQSPPWLNTINKAKARVAVMDQNEAYLPYLLIDSMGEAGASIPTELNHSSGLIVTLFKRALQFFDTKADIFITCDSVMKHPLLPKQPHVVHELCVTLLGCALIYYQSSSIDDDNSDVKPCAMGASDTAFMANNMILSLGFFCRCVPWFKKINQASLDSIFSDESFVVKQAADHAKRSIESQSLFCQYDFNHDSQAMMSRG